MRRLNLADYQAKGVAPGADPEKPLIDIMFPYPVKDTVLSIMFAPVLKLTGAELIKQQAVALKIEACKDDEILLEEEEFARVRSAFDTFAGFTRPDLELVERIRNCKEE